MGVLSVVLVAMAWLSLKAFEGRPPQQKAPSWTHPLAELKTWDLKRPQACENIDALRKELAGSTKDQIWFVDVQPQREQWILFCSSGSSSELVQRWQKGLPLDLLLELLLAENHFVIFNVHASQKPEAEGFLKLLKDYEKSTHLGIISPSRIPAETLRKERPQWLFGADRSLWTKVLAFDSMKLLGLVDLWADFYILNPGDQKALNSRKDLLSAFQERKKILIKEESGDEPLEDFYKGRLRAASGSNE